MRMFSSFIDVKLILYSETDVDVVLLRLSEKGGESSRAVVLLANGKVIGPRR